MMTPQEHEFRDTVAKRREQIDMTNRSIAKLEADIVSSPVTHRAGIFKNIDRFRTNVDHMLREIAAIEAQLAAFELEREILAARADQIEELRARLRPSAETVDAKATALVDALLSMRAVDNWVTEATTESRAAQMEAEDLFRRDGVDLNPRKGTVGWRHPAQAVTDIEVIDAVRSRMEEICRERGVHELSAAMRWNTFVRNIGG